MPKYWEQIELLKWAGHILSSFIGEPPPSFEWIQTNVTAPRLKITFYDGGPADVAILEPQDDRTPGDNDTDTCIYSGTLKNEPGIEEKWNRAINS